MPDAKVIVCESSGDWALAWRSVLGEHAQSLVETRSLVDCGRALNSHPMSLLALEATPKTFSDVIQWLFRRQRHPHARAVVMAHRSLKGYEPVIREAGALHVAYSPHSLALLAPMARRIIETASAEMGVNERANNMLPWKRHAANQPIVPQSSASKPDS